MKGAVQSTFMSRTHMGTGHQGMHTLVAPAGVGSDVNDSLGRRDSRPASASSSDESKPTDVCKKDTVPTRQGLQRFSPVVGASRAATWL